MAKKEGTSQTYGQLILFPSKEKGFTAADVGSVGSTSVRLIQGGNRPLSIKDIDSEDRKRIVLAAISADRSAIITQEGSAPPATSRVGSAILASTVVENKIEDYALVLGSKHLTPASVASRIKRAANVDLFIALKSKESEEIEFNNLKQQDMTAKFTYNFFTPEEKNYITEEDPALDPLLKNSIHDVPRYVTLTWPKQQVSENISDIENNFDLFKAGIADTKKIVPFIQEGEEFEVIDIHGLNKVFDYLSNGDNFSNTIGTTINTANSNNYVSNIPLKAAVSAIGSVVNVSKANSVNVNFSTTGFSTLFANANLEGTDPAHRASISLLAEVLKNIKVERTVKPGFYSIKELRGIEYIGYVIEKEVLIRGSEKWKKIDEFRVVGVDNNIFIDTRVVYGEVYRYRISNVIRVTKKEVTTVTRSNNVNIEKKIAEAVQKNLQLFIDSNLTTNSSNPKIEVLLFDNYYASYDGKTISTYQKTVSKNETNIRLLKNTTINIPEFKVNPFVPAPRVNSTESVTYKSSYYSSIASRNWTYLDTYETTPPPPPECIKINPNTLSNQIFISWLRPSNSQRDIRAFRIYRRSYIGENWTLLKEIKELDINSDGIQDSTSVEDNSPNMYTDKDVSLNRDYIYALTSVDIHDIESFLSVQIKAALNPNFQREKEEKPLVWVSGAGAKFDEVNFVFKKFLNRPERIIATKNIVISPNSHFGEASKSFIIKVKSLDTHETNEYVVNIVNENTTPKF